MHLAVMKRQTQPSLPGNGGGSKVAEHDQVYRSTQIPSSHSGQIARIRAQQF
jgi:hypothetical protein